MAESPVLPAEDPLYSGFGRVEDLYTEFVHAWDDASSYFLRNKKSRPLSGLAAANVYRLADGNPDQAEAYGALSKARRAGRAFMTAFFYSHHLLPKKYLAEIGYSQAFNVFSYTAPMNVARDVLLQWPDIIEATERDLPAAYIMQLCREGNPEDWPEKDVAVVFAKE